jgi:hypothetical protein
MLIFSEFELHSGYFTRELGQVSKVSSMCSWKKCYPAVFFHFSALNPASVHALMVVSDNSDIVGFYFLVFLI